MDMFDPNSWLRKPLARTGAVAFYNPSIGVNYATVGGGAGVGGIEASAVVRPGSLPERIFEAGAWLFRTGFIKDASGEVTATTFNRVALSQTVDHVWNQEGETTLHIVDATGPTFSKVLQSSHYDLFLAYAKLADVAVWGSLLDDKLTGFAWNDTVGGSEGSDILYGKEGNDTLFGGYEYGWDTDGADVLYGGAGNDVIDARSGNDTAYGGMDQDRITGGEGDDTLDGGLLQDTIIFENTAFVGRYVVPSSGVSQTDMAAARQLFDAVKAIGENRKPGFQGHPAHG
jgi:Ca2+-binding RTX toxin-like protein